MRHGIWCSICAPLCLRRERQERWRNNSPGSRLIQMLRRHSSRSIATQFAVRRRLLMSNRYRFAVLPCAVVLVCCGAWILGQKVNAAGEGKISGTVKLDGTAPHMKGIDMSKNPYCVKAHATDPAHLETVVVGSGGGLENVVVYITEGLTGPAATQTATTEPVFDQKNCMYTPHVLALDVDQKFKVTT